MRKFLTLLTVLVLFNVLAFAQTKVVTGRVTDPSGQPVPFATIRIKGAKVGTSADADGVFSIRADSKATLVISGTGITEEEVPVGESNTINIQVKRQSNNLSEVVVTALGQSQSKAKLGYATSTFNTAVINRDAPVGMLDGLEGKVAGADISTTGGPGSSTKVVLRGYGVIAGGNNQPLYVIDGVPLSDGQFQNTNGNLDFGNGMNSVNPNDIESISILKGTAASSLYGGLAKNGAIMITTKKGRAGKLKIEYDGSANFSTVGKLPTYQNEFGQGWAGVFVLDENGAWGPKLDGKDRLWGSVVDNSQLIKPFSAIPNNLRDFYTTGTEYNNSISLSGGTDVTRFYFSYGNVTSDGIIPTKSDYLERNNFSLRTNSNFEAFSINTSFNYVNQRLNVPNTGQGDASGGGVFQSLLQIPGDLPIKDFRDYHNKFFNVDNYFTPYAENPYYGLNENGDQQNSDRFFGNLDFGYKFSSNLSAELRIGGDFTNARTFDWKQPNAPSAGSWNDGGNPETAIKTPDVGAVRQGADYFGIVNSDFIVKYNRDLSRNFSLDALVGANYYQTDQRSESTTITNLVVPSFFNLSNTSLPPTTIDNTFHRKRVGLYGEVTLAYANQLYLTGNVRNDWSSTLPVSNNSIFYPGANLSWVASQNFTSTNILSFLKFRAAYGRTGADPNPYLTQAQLGSGNVGLGFGSLTFPFNGVSGFAVSNTIANAALKPIFTDEFEFGTEIKLFHNRIGIDATYYDKKTIGQIFTVPIAPSTGYTGLVENLGTVSNKGIELTLNVTPVETKDFTWSFTYLFTKNVNNVDNLTGNIQNPLLTSAYSAELRAVVGKSVASIYAPVAAKTPDGKTVVDASTGYPSLNTAPLDKYGLQNGYYGSGLYDYTMGLINTFNYKNFSLNFSLDFRYGGVMYSETADLALFVGNSEATTYNDRKPFVVPNSVNAVTDGSGKVTYVENSTPIGATGAGQTDNTWGYYYPTQNQGSSYQWRIFDRSFLKLRDITLSYKLPQPWASKIKASSTSIGVYARNLLLWTPASNIYVDPEATNLGNDLTGQLGEFASAPISKQFGVTLKVVF